MANQINQWDEKYLREQPFMPFGSMMNAYGNINNGKGMTLDEFKKSAIELFALSQDLVDKAFRKVNNNGQSDLEFPSNEN